jgi:tetratricopeptide (TPR) repeat protein
MVDRELQRLVEAEMGSPPANDLDAWLAEPLRPPVSAALRQLGQKLLASGRFDAAESLFTALLNRPRPQPWMGEGRARVASLRGDQNAAAAWADCIERFPDQVRPSWLYELAKVQGQLGSAGGAAQFLRGCAERFPPFAQAINRIADLVEEDGRCEQDTTRWRVVIGGFPQDAQPEWFLVIDQALEGLKRLTARGAVVEELAKRFSDLPATATRQASLAAQNEDWPRAVALWNALIERQPEAALPAWRQGRAWALFCTGRIEEALAAWSELLDCAPHFTPSWIAKARALQEIGHYSAARQIFDELIERFPERCLPEWLAWRAECLLEMRLDDPEIAADLDKTQTRIGAARLRFSWRVASILASTIWPHW